MKLESYIVHEEVFTQTTKPHNLPLFVTSAFDFESIDQGIKIFSGEEAGHVYSRYGNPTIETVASKITAMEAFDQEQPAFGIMVSSGMAAISTLIIALLNSGDALLTQENLYGGTTELFKKFVAKLGVDIISVDFSNHRAVEKILDKNHQIKLIYCESPANPTLACIDLPFIGKLGKTRGIQTAIDNTFCTPYLQRPFRYNFDYIIHSTTKFLNGHGNSIAGIVIGRDRANYQMVLDAMKLLGTNCNAFDAWLINNGLKTLSLRMDKHSSNALEIARRLENNSNIAKVNYPFLPSHKDYDIATNQMMSGGGMLSFELIGGLEAGIKFMNKIKFCSLAPTLGDIDTLILHPSSMSHRNIERSIRIKNGITDGLIRLSVGIEHVDDIYDDLLQAMLE